MMKRSARYSLFVKNMRGKGKLSLIALSQGKRNLLFHYKAKKRVYARRKMARQLARKMGGNRTLMERWKLGWMSSGSGTRATTGTNTNNGSISNTTTWRGITLTEPAHQSWFDEEGYPLTSRDPETGRFVNPWLSESTNGENGLKKFLRWKLGGAWCRFLEAVGVVASSNNNVMSEKDGEVSKVEIRKGEINETCALADSSQTFLSSHQYPPPSELPGLSIGEKNYHTLATDDTQESITLTWIGHSSTMVTFPGNFTIVTDPHFSNYAGPVRRAAPPAFTVADLPEVVDCVLISHDHMDHLDYWSILELIDSNKVKFWIVPLGIKSWLMDQAGVSPEGIIELEWWEGVRISKTPQNKDLNGNKSEKTLPEVEGLVRAFDNIPGQRENETEQKTHGLSPRNELVITCAPAQHWCSRTPLDRNRRLWCSFAVHATPALSQTHSFYFAGDTGLPPEFPLHHQIGDRLGPFDLSAIPIGAYEPEWFMRESHCNPAEAVRIHQAVRSRRSVAVHFDTFDLADEPREEPPKLLLDEVGVVNKNIRKMAAEVVAVADEVGIVTGLEKMRGQLVNADESLPFVERAAVAQAAANEQLIEMLPPLVDFSVIRQGQSIESLPK